MIKSLPKSLIESATHVLNMGISKNLRFYHKLNRNKSQYVDMGISYDLKEDISDWHKSLPSPTELDDISIEHSKLFTPEETQSLHNYTLHADPVNEHLLRHAYEGEEFQNSHDADMPGMDIEDYEPRMVHINHLDSALKKTTLGKPTYVYAGIRSPIVENGIYHSPRYVSTSTDPKVAISFADGKPDENGIKHIAKIKLHDRNYAAAISKIAVHQHENEVLLPRNSTFTVEHSPEEIKDDSGNVTHKIWNFVPRDASKLL